MGWHASTDVLPAGASAASILRVRRHWRRRMGARMSAVGGEGRVARATAMVAELLASARESLQGMLAQPGDELSLHQAITALRRARELVEPLGLPAALLMLDELHEIVRRQRGRSQPMPADAAKLFGRAALQLPIVLEAVAAGTTSGTEALLPMINALRRLRGEATVDLGALNAPTVSADNPTVDPVQREALLGIAREFDVCVRAWQGSASATAELKRLASICEDLAGRTSQRSGKSLFSLSAGLLAAMADQAFVGGPALRSSIADLHGEILRWANQGDACFERQPPDNAVRKLGYFATVAPTHHPRVVMLRREMGTHEPERGDMKVADARAKEEASKAPPVARASFIEKEPGPSDERRSGVKPSAFALKRELNSEQMMTLNHLERFGWELKFVRRREGKIVPVVFDSDRSTYGYLQEDGELNEKPDFHIRA